MVFQDELFGTEDTTTGPDGKTTETYRSGLIERGLRTILSRIWNDLLPWVKGTFGITLAIILWHMGAIRRLKRKILARLLERDYGQTMRTNSAEAEKAS